MRILHNQGEGIEYLRGLATWSGIERFSLDKLSYFMKELGDPQEHYRSVIIGGTNGKGSVSAALSSILGQMGLGVGLNISPHLVSMNERIVIDGCPIEDDRLNSLALRLKSASKRMSVDLTFHEALTAIAFLAFSELKVDWAVLEVGVGGRLDAANLVLNPELSCIVSIDLDHQHILGNTIEEIAAEKCGILRRSGRLVTGSLSEECRKVIKSHVAEHSAHWWSFGSEFGYLTEQSGESNTHFISRELGQVNFKASLEGEHQSHNMSVAIACGRILGATREACAAGVSEVFWPGRLESIQRNSQEFLLDCAHNPAGIKVLASYLRSRNVSTLPIAFAALPTKEWREMIDIVAPFASQWFLLEPNVEKVIDCNVIEEYLSGIDVKISRFGRDYGSFLKCVDESSLRVPILVCGSIYMVGEIRGLLKGAPSEIWRRVQVPSEATIR